ncbi:MAG: hypothetical protein ACRC9L_06525 [Brevinema sp.]
MPLSFFSQHSRSTYWLLFFITMASIGFRLLANDVENLGDISMYIAISQAIDSGNVLYKEVVDTKNAGFLFFMYWIYKPYALLFPVMTYFVLYMNILLIGFYYSITVMMYQILQKIFHKTTAFWGATLFILYFSLMGNHLNFNQPQYALLTFLLLGLYIAYRSFYRWWDYLVIGFLLGLNVAGNAPYILLTLLVPFLVWHKGITIRQYITEILFKGSVSFGGFLLGLLPYFLYFYFHDALNAWWLWQVEFPQLYTAPRWGRLLSILQWLPLATSNGGNTITRLLATVPVVAGGIYFFYLREKLTLSPIFVLVCLSALSRMIFLQNTFSWYTLYVLPAIVVLFCLWIEKKTPSRAFILFWILWAILVLRFPSENSGGILAYRNSFLRWDYDKKAAYITLKNPNKRPLVYVTPTPSTYVYSTKWVYTYYNAFAFPETNSPGPRDNNATIATLLPEVCIIDSHIRGTKGTDKYPLMKATLDHGKEIILDIPEYYPILKESYQKVSPTMYIRNDKLSEWDLSVNNNDYASFIPLVSLVDMLPLKAIRRASGAEEGSEDMFEQEAALVEEVYKRISNI